MAQQLDELTVPFIAQILAFRYRFCTHFGNLRLLFLA